MATEAAWRRLDTLPAHDGSGWAVWRGRSVPCDGPQAVKKLVKNWNPLHRVLVGAPGAPHFVPPICVEQLRDAVLKRYSRSMAVTTTVFALGAFVLLASAVAIHSSRNISFGIVATLLALTLVVDYFGSLSRLAGLSERALFFYWLLSTKPARVGFAFWTFVGLATGSMQFLLQRHAGGLDALIQAYGVMFAPVRDGEVWRLVTGPFFHSGLAHFLVNFSSLLLIGPIAWAVFGPRSVAVFFAGNVAGALVQMAWGSQAFDSYAGVSSGFLALFGFVFVSGALDRKLLPKGFGILCACVALITIAGAELLASNAASLGHLGGVAAGAACAVASRWKPIFLRPVIGPVSRSTKP